MNFVVVGAGAWGTAFAVHLARCGQRIALIPRRVEQAMRLGSTRINEEYLPGIEIPIAVQISHELSPAVAQADVVLLACPSQALRETCVRVGGKDTGTGGKWVVSLAKGLELGTHLRPSQVISAMLPGDF